MSFGVPEELWEEGGGEMNEANDPWSDRLSRIPTSLKPKHFAEAMSSVQEYSSGALDVQVVELEEASAYSRQSWGVYYKLKNLQIDAFRKNHSPTNTVINVHIPNVTMNHILFLILATLRLRTDREVENVYPKCIPEVRVLLPNPTICLWINSFLCVPCTSAAHSWEQFMHWIQLLIRVLSPHATKKRGSC